MDFEQAVVAAEPGAAADVWARFASASDAREFCGAWLAIQCHTLQGVTAALVLWELTEGSYAPAAVWPDPRRDVTYLGGPARQALSERRGLTLAGERPGQLFVAYPLETGQHFFAVAVFEIASRSDAQLQLLMRQLHWGSGWLESYFHRSDRLAQEQHLRRATAAMEVLAVACEQPNAHSALLAACNDVARRLSADRVAAGVLRRGRVKLEAISHSAWFDKHAQFVRSIENTMEEALDQGETVCFPALPDEPFRVNVAHEDFCTSAGSVAACSVILPGRDDSVGVLTVERHTGGPFDASEVALLESVALLLGPVVEPRLELHRWVAGRAVDRLRDGWRALTTPGRPAFKLGAALVAAAVFALFVAEQEFRVTAKAVVEGMVQRAAVAPFKGFVATAPVRAGELVEQGQVLATMDDRDLQLERAKWASEFEQTEQKQRDAMAKKERAAAQILAAQARQAAAQLALVDERLARSRIVAPVSGLVVTGDLSQMLGSPLEQGQVLFEIAPLDAYRVVVQVDERDIAWVQPGQVGTIVLTGRAGDPIDFRVSRVSSVSEAREGDNTFRIEAALNDPGIELRPGMEGVAKISAGEHKVVWVWTRRLVDWLRVTLWRWLP